MNAAEPEFDHADLLDAARRGEPSAGPVLVSLFAPGLRNYMRLRARDLGDADLEDLCERVVITAVRKIDAYDRANGTFDGWLRGFARLELLAFRRQRAAALPVRDDLPAPVEPSPARSERDELALAAFLKAGLDQLSPADQLIISLRDTEQLSYAAIAERFGGVSEAACRQRHVRALRRLEHALRKDDHATQFLPALREVN